MFLPSRIKECREERGLSQEDLMLQMANEGRKVSRPTISGWENGESLPNAHDLETLSFVFKKPIKYFFASQHN
jgi:transcriptional regulator with XRE-family HTH domain